MTNPNFISRYQFAKDISERCEDISVKQVKEVLEAFDDAMMEMIATNHFTKFSFGWLGGKMRKTIKMSGYSALYAADPYGYSLIKCGIPVCTFNADAKLCTLIPPHEFFANPENQYGKEWEKYKEEMENDFGGEKFKSFLGLYGLPKEERKEKRRKQEIEYKKKLRKRLLKKRNPKLLEKEPPITFEEISKLPMWAEGIERNI